MNCEEERIGLENVSSRNQYRGLLSDKLVNLK